MRDRLYECDVLIVAAWQYNDAVRKLKTVTEVRWDYCFTASKPDPQGRHMYQIWYRRFSQIL